MRTQDTWDEGLNPSTSILSSFKYNFQTRKGGYWSFTMCQKNKDDSLILGKPFNRDLRKVKTGSARK